MLILKIKDKGLYVEIPGALPTRTPAEINITKCNLSAVDAYLRKCGISNYQIMSGGEMPNIVPELPKIKDSSINQKLINKRFSNLENMLAQLLEKQLATTSKNPEQITDKLDKLELLSKKILNKEPKIVRQGVVSSSVNKSKRKRFEGDPEIEELDKTFIPKIDVSKMKLKGASKKTIKQDKQDKHDIDDSADLLSRIMGQDD